MDKDFYQWDRRICQYHLSEYDKAGGEAGNYGGTEGDPETKSNSGADEETKSDKETKSDEKTGGYRTTGRSYAGTTADSGTTANGGTGTGSDSGTGTDQSADGFATGNSAGK